MASTDWNPVLSTVGSSGHPSLEDLRSSVVDALAAYNAGGFPLTFDTQTPGPPLPIMCVKWELQNGHLVIIYNYAVGVTAAPGDTCFLPPRQALRSLFPQIGNMDIRYHAQISYDLGAA
ncbi:MAG TPA: hypothetical protein VKE69_09220 [Planctomycetota bacterium]|nr:hypothetical protein [Planctomycetota bacterium]